MNCANSDSVETDWEANNTELLRWAGSHPLAPSRAYVSVDLHTCAAGHSHYIITAQTENVTDDLDEATVAAQLTVSAYMNAGYPMARTEI